MLKIAIAKWRNVIIRGLFLFLGGLAVIFVIKTLSNPVLSGNPLAGFMDTLMSAEWILLMAACLLALHAVWTLGYKRGLSFITLIFIAGLVSEIIGVNYGLIFGGFYSYHRDSQLMLWGVPLMIPLFWGAFIYAGYNISTSFLYWLNKKKPDKYANNWKTLLLLILLDGLIVVAIDLVMDPLQVQAGNWVWVSAGNYYQVPVNNFIGWFAVTAITTGIFRFYEYLNPKLVNNFNVSMFLIPLCGYLLLCFGLIGLTLKANLPYLTIIGLCTMLPIAVINLALFIRWHKKQKATQTTVLPADCS
ncbi:MAG: carotenoid biosynthesis protein [Dehalococcoidales bacterium]|nr:carotenoid biosynthesis protein [Dehalococcoidales bacterium]